MPKDKSTGKKLADMMYGNPDRAAFGITPMIGKRREDRQDREAAKSFPVDLARGVVAGAVGLPGDIESLARLPYELMTGNESPTFLPTSEDVLKRIPFGTNTPAGQFASGLGTLAGGSANIGAVPRAVKAAPGALKTAARNLSTPRTMSPEAGAVRIKAPSAPQERAMRLAQQRAALPIERGGLGLPANNTAEQRAMAMGINTDAYHGSKQDITGAFKPGYDDNLAFVTKSPEFANKWIGKGKYTQRSGEQAQQEVKSAEDAYRQIRSRNMNYDDALERLKGEEFDNEYDRRRALAMAEAEREFGTPGNADKIHSTVYPLKVEANRTFNPETDMDVMAEFFEKNEIPPKLQELYAGGNYMMYETKPVVEFLKSKGYDSMRLRESTGDDYPTIAVFNPETTRSRFAAFDPFRKDVATATAMGVAAPDLLANEINEEDNKARGGRVHISDNPDVMALELAGGGLVKGIKAAAKASKASKAGADAPKQVVEAPSIIIPGTLSQVKEAIRQSKGEYGAKRVQRAADEVKNLERLYKERALIEAFGGDNAKALMSMRPEDFERFAHPLTPLEKPWPGSGPKKETLSTDEYIKYLSGVDQFHDVPFLEINKQEQGLPMLPFISGHEGRHRNRALAERGEKAGLVQLLPRAELREPFPRRSQEEYIDALKRELEMTENLVLPEKQTIPGENSFGSFREIQRPAIVLPDIYAEGGAVRMQAGGAVRMAGGGEVHGLSTADLLFLQSQEDLGKLPAHAQREAIANMSGQEVRQRMAGKMAAGGEITADDLILEERKL